MRYFITFACYGARIHGDDKGSVDPRHNLRGAPLIDPSKARATVERQRMDQPPFLLDAQDRAAVLDTLHEVCTNRGWTLFAAHVRTNHVHAVVEATVLPEKVMNAFKAYASRRLNRASGCEMARKRWSRHGSTRWLWNDRDVRTALRYVVEEQGEAKAVFVRQN
jgi:REP element-mobilizing transposase RayT